MRFPTLLPGRASQPWAWLWELCAHLLPPGVTGETQGQSPASQPLCAELTPFRVRFGVGIGGRSCVLVEFYLVLSVLG